MIPKVTITSQILYIVYTGKETPVSETWKTDDNSLMDYHLIFIINLNTTEERAQIIKDCEIIKNIIGWGDLVIDSFETKKKILVSHDNKSHRRLNKYHLLNYISDFLEFSPMSWKNFKENVVLRSHSPLDFIGNFVRKMANFINQRNGIGECSMEEIE